MSEKGQPRKSMFVIKNMEELRLPYDTDTPVLAYAFKVRQGTQAAGSPAYGNFVSASSLFVSSPR